MEEQLDLLEGFYKEEEKEKDLIKLIIKKIRDVRYLRRLMEELEYILEDISDLNRIEGASRQLETVDDWLRTLSYTESRELDEYKDKDYSHYHDDPYERGQISVSEDLSVDGVYKVYLQTQKSLRSDLNSLKKDFKHPSSGRIFDYMMNSIEDGRILLNKLI